MRRRILIGLGILFVFQATTTWAMSPVGFSATVSASGVIDIPRVTVTAPRITAPVVVTPLDSFAKQSNPINGVAVQAAVDAVVDATKLSAKPARKSGGRAQASLVTPAGIVQRFYVSEGRRVRKGAVLAKIDDRLLRLAVTRNRAALLEAKAQVLIVDENLSDLEDKQRDLDDAKDKLRDGKSRLADARRAAQAGLSKLSTMQAQLEAQRRRLAGMRTPNLPMPIPTTGTPLPPIPNIPALEAQLAAGLSRLNTMREKLESGLALLESKSAELAAAEAKLDRAENQLAEARVKLRAARTMALAGVRSAASAVEASRAELARALVRSPADGVITELPVDAGELVFSSQPLATIAQVEQAKLLLYLPPDEAQSVRAGDRARIRIDTFPDRSFPAKVSLVASRVQFAPSNTATDRVYLSEVQAVTLLAANREGILKTGMPADAEIDVR